MRVILPAPSIRFRRLRALLLALSAFASLYLTVCTGEHGAHILYPGSHATSANTTLDSDSIGVTADNGGSGESLVHSPDGVDVLPRAESGSGIALLALLGLFLLPHGDRLLGGCQRPAWRRRRPPMRAEHGRAFLLTVCVART
ncbi:hypothetical protein ALI144C_18755 [Actinosynnema sp. ALI-1.44]|nr:hypothetical protein ALI144C_18755 [Actinosynnema sp. ALI-1.44]